MDIDFPIAAEALLTVVGSALFAGLVTQWLKQYIAGWRYLQLVVLALALLFSLAAQAIVSQGLTWAGAMAALLIGFAGASLATFGYEGIVNIRGALGKGPRSEAALLDSAKELTQTKGARVVPYR